MRLTYLCPALNVNCQWEGNEENVVQHFENSHNKLLWNSNIIKVPIKKANKQNQLMQHLGHVFLVQSNIFYDDCSNKTLKIRLRYLGSARDVLTLSYSIKFTINRFTFDSNNTNFSKHCEDGSIEANLETMVLYENTNVHNVFCTFNFANLQFKSKKQPVLQDDVFATSKVDLLSDIFEEDINAVNADVTMQSPEISEATNKALFKEVNKEAAQDILKRQERRRERLNRRSIALGESFCIKRMFLEEEDINTNPVDSATKTAVSSQESFKKSVICNYCHMTMVPPIYMCNSGHSVCCECKEKLCKKCNLPVTIRSTSLEVRSKSVLHACRFAAMCLTDALPYSDVRSHIVNCKYMIFMCPNDSFKGSLQEMQSHYKIVHPSLNVEMQNYVCFGRETNLYIFSNLGFFSVKSLLKDNIWNITVNYCSPFQMYFHCEVLFNTKKNKEHKYVLERNKNKHSCSIKLSELNDKKIKKGFLNILQE